MKQATWVVVLGMALAAFGQEPQTEPQLTMTETLAMAAIRGQIAKLNSDISAFQVEICAAHGLEPALCRLDFTAMRIVALPPPETAESDVPEPEEATEDQPIETEEATESP